MRLPRFVVPIVVALSAVGCGSSGSHSSASTSAPSQSSLPAITSGTKPVLKPVQDHGTSGINGSKLAIEAGDFYFAPTYVNVANARGATLAVTITNKSANPHTFTIDALGIDKTVNAGESVTVEVSVPATGTVVFYCRFHQASGMQGEFF